MEKAEVQRVMWSPYPDHQLTLWAMAPQTPLLSSHLDGPATVRSRQRRQLQGWQISRNFSSTRAKGRTTEILATHRLNFGNQSITRLCIPRASLEFLTALVELRMPQNKLKQLPHSLFELKGLEILNLENNALNEQCADDRWWPLLERLRVLFLAGNRFEQLPPSLGRMPHLFYVDVSDNHKLTALPAELVRAPSVGTLAASRCSLDLANMLGPAQSLPFEDRVPANMPWSSPVRVPPLVALCLRTIGRASKQTTDFKQTTDSNQSTESCPERYDAISCTHLMDACDEVRRRPDDFVVLDRMLDTLRDMDGLCACSVCGEPVILGSFSFVRMEPGWELPVVWRCCSATCRDSCFATA
ncbi:hypothetical protein GGH20_000041 [Coemansia sp. RSA 1937]|nr:hypothetical protein GGH20_000041 [Coemansia sp. RSA 1937]